MGMGVKKIGATTADTVANNSLDINTLLCEILKELKLQTMVLQESFDTEFRNTDIEE